MPCAVDSPQASDATVNSRIPPTNKRRWPKWSPSRPPSSRKPPNVSMYALTTHASDVWEKPREPADRWQGDVHDRGVEDDHQRAHAEQDKGSPAVSAIGGHGRLLSRVGGSSCLVRPRRSARLIERRACPARRHDARRTPRVRQGDAWRSGLGFRARLGGNRAGTNDEALAPDHVSLEGRSGASAGSSVNTSIADVALGIDPAYERHRAPAERLLDDPTEPDPRARFERTAAPRAAAGVPPSPPGCARPRSGSPPGSPPSVSCPANWARALVGPRPNASWTGRTRRSISRASGCGRSWPSPSSKRIECGLRALLFHFIASGSRFIAIAKHPRFPSPKFSSLLGPSKRAC